MHLEIKDIQSSRSVRIESGDRILGREGANADIGIPDRAVSGKHARIFNSAGKWYLEDLGSSNGTFVQGKRISSPTELTTGLRFALCRYAFEVAQVGASTTDATAVFQDAGYSEEAARTQVGSAPTFSHDPPASGATDPAQDNLAKAITGSGQAAEAPTRGQQEADAAHPRRGTEKVDPEAPPGSNEPLIPYLLKNVPLAIGYYIAAVPVLLSNPMGTVRKGIENMKFPAMGKMELAAYGAAAALAQIAFGWVGGLLAAIISSITGVFSVGLIISALIDPLFFGAITLAVSVVVALFWHPIMSWIVQWLKGTCDAAGRSNYFVVLQTAMLIYAMAGAISQILASVHISFIGVPGPLVALAGILITSYVAFVWMKHFQVHKIIPILILIGGALSSFGTVTRMIGILSDDISRLGSGGDIAASGDIEAALAAAAEAGEMTPEVAEAMALAQKSQAEAAAMADDPAAAAEMMRKNAEAAAAALAGQNPAAAEALAKQQAAVAAAMAAAGAQGTVVAEIPVTEEAPGSGTSVEGGSAAILPEPAVTGIPAPPQPIATSTTVLTKSVPVPAAGRSGYPAYRKKRDAIEAAIKNDPTVVDRKQVKALFRELYRVTAKVQQRNKVKLSKRATPEKLAEAKLAESVREAEVYKATVGIVDELHGVLF